MKVYNCLDDFNRPDSGCVLTIGNFDGVHRGHLAIIQRGRAIADKESMPLVGMTFDPAPVRLLRPDKTPQVITPLELKIKLLANYGMDCLIVVEPNAEFLSLEPEEFVNRIPIGRLNARHIVEGSTFCFGKGGAGSMELLKKSAKKTGFMAHQSSPVKEKLGNGDEVMISSTLIRHLVLEDRFSDAAKCLGRDYMLTGSVVTGRGKGREIGFPTANIKPHYEDQLLPKDGVFAGWVQLDDKNSCPAAISIGQCRTFKDGKWQIEAFLLDYEENEKLAGQDILLGITEKIRDQQKFDTSDELAKRIEKDCEIVKSKSVITRHFPD